ncbi:MAG: T9SS type A sorting domain-containing protein [Clostridiales bacterium]|nr:T9SS type A sorting domain-containing protein [Clostridiales bacterium]
MKKIFIITCVLIAGIGLLMAQNNTLDFDGTDDYIEVPDASSLNFGTGDFTISLWLKSTLSSDGILVEKIWDVVSSAGGNGWAIQLLSNGRFRFSLADTYEEDPIDFQSIGGNIWNDGKWHHLAIVVDRSSNVSFYIDGIADRVGDITSESGSLSNTYPLLIGANYNKNATKDSQFDGFIDEVHIWNDVRTQAEIRANMYHELVGTESNLVAYYNCNATSGTTLTDNSTNSNTGTLSNMTGSEWTTSSAYFGPKNCLDFDGTNDYVDLGSSTSLKPTTALSAEAWVYMNDWTPNERKKIIANTEDGGWALSVSSTETVELEIYNGTQYIKPNFDCSALSGWHHVAGVFDGSNTMLYVDGDLKSTVSMGASTIDYSTTTNSTLIGAEAGSGSTATGNYFSGKIDEVRIWNDARTASEIRKNMYKTLVGNESGLVAYYNFDNVSGTTLQDFSGNTNDGTLQNMDNADWVSSTAFNTWLNTNSSSWSTASNWSRGSSPVSTDNIGIYTYSGGTNVSLSGSPTVNNLLLGGSSSMTLSSAATINGNLILESNLDLNGQTITLGSSATLVEGTGLLSGTSGTITTTRTLNNIDENVAGLGAEITTSGNMGSTEITRSHTAPGSQAIKRKYYINPTNNSGLSATLVFHYDDSELNGQTESTLKLFKSADGSSWTEQASSINTTDNTMTLSSIDAFSYWTGAPTGSEEALPVELSSFTATNQNGNIALTWCTETETENQGYILEKLTIENGQLTIKDEEWATVADYLSDPALVGQGSTTESHTYQYLDDAVQSGVTYVYRLGDVDYNNKITWHKNVEIKVEAEEEKIPAEFGLEKAYPNPFNPSITLNYGLTEDAQTTLLIYNMRGQLVETLQNGNISAGNHSVIWQPMNISTGMYIVRLRSGNNTNMQKIVYVK